MKKLILVAPLFLASGYINAAAAVDSDSVKLGVVGTAAITARVGAFLVVDECEKRFDDLRPEGKVVRSSWTKRNAEAEKKLAAVTEKVAARWRTNHPGANTDAVLVQARDVAQQTSVKEASKVIASTLSSPDKAAQHLTCRRMFAGLNQGAMDILNIQKTAVSVMDEEASREGAGSKPAK